MWTAEEMATPNGSAEADAAKAAEAEAYAVRYAAVAKAVAEAKAKRAAEEAAKVKATDDETAKAEAAAEAEAAKVKAEAEAAAAAAKHAEAKAAAEVEAKAAADAEAKATGEAQAKAATEAAKANAEAEAKAQTEAAEAAAAKEAEAAAEATKVKEEAEAKAKAEAEQAAAAAGATKAKPETEAKAQAEAADAAAAKQETEAKAKVAAAEVEAAAGAKAAEEEACATKYAAVTKVVAEAQAATPEQLATEATVDESTASPASATDLPTPSPPEQQEEEDTPAASYAHLKVAMPTEAATSSTSVALVWDEVPVEACEYVLEMAQGAAGGGGDKEWTVVYQGHNRAFKLIGLQPNAEYAFRLRVLCGDGVSPPPPSPCLSLCTPAAAPGAPGPVALAARTFNALKVNWSPPKDTGGVSIVQYTLRMAPVPAEHTGAVDAAGFGEVYTGAAPSVRVGKLAPGTTYTLHVVATNVVGAGPPSEDAVFETAAAAPAVPGGLSSTATTSTSVSLVWTEPPGQGAAVAAYTVEVSSDMGRSFRFAAETSETSHTLTGLTGGTLYGFRVRAENQAGKSAWCKMHEACTGATPPEAPGAAAATTTTVDSVSVTWAPPSSDGGSPVQGYEVEVQTPWLPQEAGVWRKAFMVVAEECTLHGLRPGSSYLLRTRAVNHMGAGAPSKPSTVLTQSSIPTGPPESLAVTSVSRGVVHLAWQPPVHDGGAAITHYQVDAACVAPPAGTLPGELPLSTFHPVMQSTTTSAALDGLPPGGTWFVRVWAQNRHGGSSVSGAVEAHTPPLPPAAPEAPALADIPKSRSLTVAWTIPACRGAYVTAYHLEVAEAEAAAAGGSEKAWERKYTGGDTLREVGGLTPHTSYTFRVQAVNTAGGGEWSDHTKLCTAPAAPSAPAAPTVLATTADAVSLKWAAPANTFGSPVVSYTLEAATGDPYNKKLPLKYEAVYTGAATEFELNRLESGRRYAFRLRAQNAVGTSPASTAAAAATAAAAPAPPRAPSFTAVQSGGFKARWAPPEHDNGAAVIGYEVECSADGTKRQTVRLSGDACVHKFARLAATTTYRVRVRALSTAGASGWSGAGEVATLLAPPPPPTALTATATSSASVAVQWSSAAVGASGEATAEAVSYELDMAVGDGNAESAFQMVFSGAACAHTVGNLKPAMRYRFRVRSNGGTGHGFGEHSAAVSVSTPVDTHAADEVTAEAAGQNHHGWVAGVGAAGSADTPGPRKREKGKRKAGRGGGGSSGSAAIVGDGDVGGSMRAGEAPLLLRTVADALGIERWMSSDKLDARLALQVAERQAAAAAAGGSAKYKPPKLKRWYEKVWKACRKVATYTLMVAAVVALLYLLFSVDWNPKPARLGPRKR